MHRISGLALGLAALLIAGASYAESPKVRQNEESRIYLGGSAVFSYLTTAEDDFKSSASELKLGTAYGAALTYGVRMPYHMSIELDFEWIEGYETELDTVLGTYVDSLITFALNSVFAYRPREAGVAIDPYVSVGAGWMRAKLDVFGPTADGMAFRFGIGSDFWVSDHFGFRVEGRYLLPVSSSIRDLDSVSPRIGIFYRF
jgi:opacity protein-like surface antigen